jgi:hypothetical protein
MSTACSAVRYYRGFLCQLNLDRTSETELFLEDIVLTDFISIQVIMILDCVKLPLDMPVQPVQRRLPDHPGHERVTGVLTYPWHACH